MMIISRKVHDYLIKLGSRDVFAKFGTLTKKFDHDPSKNVQRQIEVTIS